MKRHLDFFKSNLLILFAANLAAALNYISQIFISRNLPTDEVGTYFAVSSVAVVFFSFLTIVQIISAAAFIRFNERNQYQEVIRRVFKTIGIVTFVLLLLVNVNPEPIANRLSLSSTLALRIYSVQLLIAIPIACITGVLQGRQRFGTLALKELLAGILRLGLLLALVVGVARTAVIGVTADLATMIGILIYLAMNAKADFSGFSLSRSLGQPGAKELGKIWRYGTLAMSSQWVIGIGLQVDILLAKMYLSPEQAGVFAAVSGIAKITYFAGSSLTTILLPRVMSEANQKISSTGSMAIAMLLMSGCAGAVSLICVAYPQWIIIHTLGDRYLAGSHILSVSSISMALLALNSVIINFFVGKNSFGFLPYCAGGLLIGLGYLIKVHPGSGDELSQGILAVVCLVFIVNALLLAKKLSKAF